MGRVKEIEGPVGPTRFASAFRVSLVTALTLLVALPGTAFGASTVMHVTEQDPFKVDPITELPIEITLLRVDGGPEGSTITVTLTGDIFTVTDTGGATAGPGCLQAGTNTVTCSRNGTHRIDRVDINGNDGADNINGSPLGDQIEAGPGDDVINSGFGGIDTDPASPTYCGGEFTATGSCSDFIDAGQGFDTITYTDRTQAVCPPSPTPCVRTDLRPGRNGVDSDQTSEGIENAEKVIGGSGSDELVGGNFNDTLNGGPGDAPDTICGALGKDTVDYSDKDLPVRVDFAGLEDDPATPAADGLPTDTDLLDPGSTAAAAGARRDCRPVIKNPQSAANGLPCTSNSPAPSCNAWPRRDCTANDGVPRENDCVGEDVENVIGGDGNDVLIGNDPDPLYGRSPRVEPIGENVLTGGPGDDFMFGSLGPDIFDGGEGNDVVSYAGRTESIAASIDGSANDGGSLDFNPRNNLTDEITGTVESIIGGDAKDVLKGDSGGNTLVGGPGDDLIQGLAGGDDLDGEGGLDTLQGGADNDLLDGGADNDTLHGGDGRDAIDGGDGTDTADYSDATTRLRVIPDGLANDGTAHEGDNIAPTIESLVGGLDDDVLVGNDGNGRLDGGGGNDTLDGGLGADDIFGGSGLDTATYGSRAGPVNVDLAAGGGDGAPGENDSVQGDVEGVLGGSGDDVISGSGDVNILNGGPGNDRVSGAGGDDHVAGDVGNDTLNGDAGNDIVDGAEGNDTVNGNAGNDTVKGFHGNDVLDGGAGSDTINGGIGVDTVSYASRSGDVTVDTAGTPNDGERNENDLVRTDIESVRTGSGDDNINIVDGAAGTATCGGGRDGVTADADDEVGSGCESNLVRQTAICRPSGRSARMSGSGVVSLRLRCAFSARGTLRLVSASRVKAGKGKARRLTLGRKSFSGKAGNVTVRVKVAKSARSVVKRKKRLRVKAEMRTRRAAAGAAMRSTSSTLTVRAGK